MTFNEKLIEQVARALVVSTGKDPDEKIDFEPEHGGWNEHGPRWHAHIPEARKQAVAFHAIREFYRMTGKHF